MPGAAYLEGDDLTLRTVTPDDYGFLADAWNDPDVRRVTDRQEPVTEAFVAGMVEESEDCVCFLPCREGDGSESVPVPVGFAWLFQVDDVAGRAEVGYWIVESERGNGYATEATELLAEYAFVDRGLRKLAARVFEGNDASVRVLEKAGFEAEGRLREHYWSGGEYVDVTFYARFAEESPPRE